MHGTVGATARIAREIHGGFGRIMMTDPIIQKYDGVADFFLRANQEEKIAVFTEVAHLANEEQWRIYQKAISIK